MGITIIACILWCILSTLIFIEYMPYCYELNCVDMLAVIIIFLIGGPIFAINNILTLILSFILPEGWDDDDDIKKH